MLYVCLIIVSVDIESIRVTASSLNIHTSASFAHQSNSNSPTAGAVIDLIDLKF